MDLRLVFPKTCSVEVQSWHNAPERKAKTEIKLIALKQAIPLSVLAPGHLPIHLYTIFVISNFYLYLFIR